MKTWTLTLLVVALTATLLTIDTATARAAKSEPYYVALGDSRAVGLTWTSQLTDGICGRTPSAYPNLVAKSLHVKFRSVACGGAKTTDLLRGQQVLLTNVPPQVDALSTHTKLITLSIGGNDLDWSTLISPCFSRTGTTHCRTDRAMQARIATKLASLSANLDRLLGEIRRRSPEGRIVVVGHGGYFGSKGCTPDAPMSDADAPTVADFFRRFNDVLRTAAVQADATFVDIAGPAQGHDVCAGAQRWFVGDWPRGDVPLRHPTPLGATNMARLIVDALG